MLSGVNQAIFGQTDEARKLLLWCLRSYPFQCSFLKWLEDFNSYFEETLRFVDDPDLLSILDEIEICSICLECLKYERARSALSSMAEARKERGCKGAWKQGIYNSETLKIGDLKLDLIGVRLRTKVVEKSEPRIVDTRNGRLLFSMAVVSDNTGIIRMPLWGRRVSMVSVGDTVLVEGARVKEYFGELQLLIERGKLTVEVESLGEEASKLVKVNGGSALREEL